MNRIRQFKKIRWFAALAFVAAVIGGGVALDQSQAQHVSSKPTAPEVTVAAVITRPVQPMREFTGHIEAVNTVNLRPRVNGYIQSVNFEPGEHVEKGQLLFRIDPRPYKAEVERLEAKLAQAKSQYELAESNAGRARKLLPDGAISRKQADKLKADARSAHAQVVATRASLKAARLQLDFTQVRAPIDGRVGKALITPGNLVTDKDVLTTVLSTSPVYVEFSVNEHSYLRLLNSRLLSRNEHGVAKLPVSLGLADETGYPHHGYLNFVANDMDDETGTIALRATFDNAKGQLTPGLFARIKLPVGRRKQAVLIDNRAVGTDLNSKYVYVLDDQRKAEYRAVTLGASFHGLRVVESGLRAGDVIVVNGLQRIRSGVKVNADRVAMDRRLSKHERAIVRADTPHSRRAAYNDASGRTPH